MRPSSVVRRAARTGAISSRPFGTRIPPSPAGSRCQNGSASGRGGGGVRRRRRRVDGDGGRGGRRLGARSTGGALEVLHVRAGFLEAGEGVAVGDVVLAGRGHGGLGE